MGVNTRWVKDFETTMKYITYIVLVVAMFCLGCSSRHQAEEIPVDISGLGKAGEIIKDYEASVQAPFSNGLFPKLDDCLYALAKSNIVQENLSTEDITKLRNFLFQRFVGLLEQEFQEGFCDNKHDYFAKLRAAVDTLQTKYKGIPQEQQQTLSQLADWYQQHQNACSAGIAFPSKLPATLSSKYDVVQAERVIQAIQTQQGAYKHSSRCDECKNYLSRVKKALLRNYESFVAELVSMYGREDTPDDTIEKSIEEEINKLEDFASKYHLSLSSSASEDKELWEQIVRDKEARRIAVDGVSRN